MNVGDRVRVATSIRVFHHPAHRKTAFDLQGMEGRICDIITDWHGRPISPNYPIVVDFGGNFRAHFSREELEPVA